MHRPTPPSLSDALASVITEVTHLHNLDDMRHTVISFAPHSILAAPQSDLIRHASQMPSGYGAPV